MKRALHGALTVNQLVAISSVGTQKAPEAKRLFLLGYNEMLRLLCPSKILFFGDVPEGQPMVYLNSLLNVSVALNMDNFAQKHQVASGADWNIDVKKCAK